MSRTAYSFAAVTLLIAAVATFGAPRIARANDTGALIGGLIAGAIVYELLDDDDDGPYCRRYYHYDSYPGRYYSPPVYYRQAPRYYTPSYGTTIWYDQRYPSRRTRYYRDYDWAPRYAAPGRAPSHAQRNVGPPPLYQKHGKKARGGKYQPPRRYSR